MGNQHSLSSQLAMNASNLAGLQSGRLPPANDHINGGNYMVVWSRNEQKKAKSDQHRCVEHTCVKTEDQHSGLRVCQRLT